MNHRKVLILRHGEALQQNFTDFERPLTEAGRKEIASTADQLQMDYPIAIDAVYASNAIRAKTSAELFLKALQSTTQIQVVEKFYHADLQYFRDFLATRDSDESTILLVGHNPILSEFATYLTGQSINLRTGELALLNCEQQVWSQLIFPKAFDLLDLISPL